MKFSGLNRKEADVQQELSSAFNLENVRLSVDGELRRRPGMTPGSWAPVTGVPIASAMAFPPTGGPSIIIQQANGQLDGFAAPLPTWTDPYLLPPTVAPVPFGCSPGLTVSHTFSYANQSIFDTFDTGTHPLLTGCCYQCVYTVVSNLTLHSGISSLVSTQITYNGLPMQGLEDCHGVTNTLYATGATYGGAVVGLVSTTVITKFSVNSQSGYWFAGAFPLVFRVTEDTVNGQTYDGTIAMTFTITPSATCAGC